ncbi:MAG: ATP synthase F1 subunit epsilon [Pseudobdellovibrionaceae bacterium]
MNLTFVTPEKKILVNHAVESVVVPGFRGELDLREGHAPLMTTLKVGIMRWKNKSGVDANKVQKAVVTWGYCEVSPDGVKVLADIVDFPEEIDAAAAKQGLINAEKKLVQQTLSDKDREETQKEMARMNAQLQLLKEIGRGS